MGSEGLWLASFSNTTFLTLLQLEKTFPELKKKKCMHILLSLSITNGLSRSFNTECGLYMYLHKIAASSMILILIEILFYGVRIETIETL